MRDFWQKHPGAEFGVRRTPGTRVANSRGETIYTPPEGESIIRDKLRDFENFMHADDGPGGMDVLVKLALMQRRRIRRTTIDVTLK